MTGPKTRVRKKGQKTARKPQARNDTQVSLDLRTLVPRKLVPFKSKWSDCYHELVACENAISMYMFGAAMLHAVEARDYASKLCLTETRKRSRGITLAGTIELDLIKRLRQLPAVGSESQHGIDHDMLQAVIDTQKRFVQREVGLAVAQMEKRQKTDISTRGYEKAVGEIANRAFVQLLDTMFAALATK